MQSCVRRLLHGLHFCVVVNTTLRLPPIPDYVFFNRTGVTAVPPAHGSGGAKCHLCGSGEEVGGRSERRSLNTRPHDVGGGASGARAIASGEGGGRLYKQTSVVKSHPDLHKRVPTLAHHQPLSSLSSLSLLRSVLGQAEKEEELLSRPLPSFSFSLSFCRLCSGSPCPGLSTRE